MLDLLTYWDNSFSLELITQVLSVLIVAGILLAAIWWLWGFVIAKLFSFFDSGRG